MDDLLRQTPEQLGPHGADILELLAVAASLFQARGEPAPPKGVVVYRQLPECSEYNGPGNIHQSEVAPGTFCYLDLIENEVGEVVAAAQCNEHREEIGRVRDEIGRLFDQDALRQMIFRSMRAPVYEYRYWILDHLAWIAERRVVFGKRPGLLESIFEVYRSGGFPFGFQYGEHGEVELLAYYP